MTIQQQKKATNDRLLSLKAIIICMSEHDWNIAVVEGSLKRTLHIGTSVNID